MLGFLARIIKYILLFVVTGACLRIFFFVGGIIIGGYNRETYLKTPRISMDADFTDRFFAGNVPIETLSRVEFVLPPRVWGTGGLWGEDHPAFARISLSLAEIADLLRA